LRFRPDDGYSKPTCGDRHSTNGFLLRVRIKKNNKVTQVKNATMELIKLKSMDTTNLKVTPSYISKDLDIFHSKSEQINATFNIARKKNTHEGNICVDNLINQEKDCTHNVDSIHCNNEEAAEKKYATDNKNLHDACIDNSPSRKKKNIFTFDNNKYKNLSQETYYKVPRLKILGKIETEFKFTSMFYLNYTKNVIFINFVHTILNIKLY